MNKQRQPFFVIAGIILFIAAIFGVRLLILGGVAETPLADNSAAQQASGSLSNSADTLQPDKPPLVAGTDYTFGDTHYFDNDQWLVAKVTLTSVQDSDSALIVMRRQNGTYQTMLGPGTAFSGESLQQIPKDVAAYLRSLGAVYADNP
jgi:hypothetical protein